MKELALFVLGCVLFVCGMFAIAFQLDGASCKARWNRSGYAVEYGVMQGCLVQRKDGTWVSETNLRDLSLGEAK